ncbi:MAG: HAD-IB family hydrolase [Acidimicrobiales bacterium]
MSERGRGAAFFDLDRTLLRGGSGPVISEALKQVGLLKDRTLPGERVVFRMYELFGENRLSMTATRNAARFAAGWARAAAEEAGRLASDALVAAVQPFARPIIDEHHDAGRPVVLATTTPLDIVRPFAERLGLDDVIATRYGLRDDGTYAGTIEGEFVWGQGKLRAVRAWADERAVDLRGSWAYSDSWFDVPLLSAVGNPVAVNPDPRLLATAILRRWPVRHLDVPAGIPKVPVLGLEPQQIALLLGRPELLAFVRWNLDGWEHIPKVGPAILVSNHGHPFDPIAIGAVLAKRHRPARFLTSGELFDSPVIGPVMRAMGGIRLGGGDDAPALAEAIGALGAGQLVALLPRGRSGRSAAALAAASKAPVLPVGLWGTERVWPRGSRVPRVWQVVDPPLVHVRVGSPVDGLTYDAATDGRRIMDAVENLLPPAGSD